MLLAESSDQSLILSALLFFKEWIIDTSILIELISLLILVPLLAALVERSNRRKLQSSRKLIIYRLFANVHEVIRKHRHAVISLNSLTSSEYIDKLLETSNKALVEAIQEGNAGPKMIEQNLSAIEFSETLVQDAMIRAKHALEDCQRACAVAASDGDFSNIMVAPHELNRMADIRSSFNTIEESCFSFSRAIDEIMSTRRTPELRLCDPRKLVNAFRELLADFGESGATAPKAILFFERMKDRLSGFRDEDCISEKERQDLSTDAEKWLNEKNLIISPEQFEELAKDLLKVKVIERYNKLRNNVHEAISRDQPGEGES